MLWGVHATEQRTADTNCSEFRYFSCVLKTGLKYVLYYYESGYTSLLTTGQWVDVIQLCRYRYIKFYGDL